MGYGEFMLVTTNDQSFLFLKEMHYFVIVECLLYINIQVYIVITLVLMGTYQMFFLAITFWVSMCIYSNNCHLILE